LIYLRKRWNHFELSELIEIDKDDAKKLLQIFGYKYDNYIGMYVQQEISIELREKLCSRLLELEGREGFL